MNYLKTNGLSLLLYALLGIALGASGVGVMDKPVEFCIILALVLGIELLSFKRGATE